MSDRNPYLDAANASGFPLQIAVENAIASTKETHGWSVFYREHSWKNYDDGRSGFIDLVLKNQYQTVSMVIECKRVRDTAWIFMSSDGPAVKTGKCKAWVTSHFRGSFSRFGWENCLAIPALEEASFCAVRGLKSDSPPMLERIAAELVSSTEALAQEERDFRPEHDGNRWYFSVILTTAELMFCKFSPGQISLKTGVLDESSDFLSVPFVRFRKQLKVPTSGFSKEDYIYGPEVARRKEHTVFVVNSEKIVDFLREFDFR